MPQVPPWWLHQTRCASRTTSPWSSVPPWPPWRSSSPAAPKRPQCRCPASQTTQPSPSPRIRVQLPCRRAPPTASCPAARRITLSGPGPDGDLGGRKGNITPMSEVPPFGAEEELLLVDPASGAPRGRAGRVRDEASGDLDGEMRTEQVETATAPHH